MKISHDVYRELVRLFQKVAAMEPLPPEIREDLDLVRDAIVPGVDGAELLDGAAMAKALSRLISSHPDFAKLRSLLTSASLFASPTRGLSLGGRDLYANSLLLRTQVSAADRASPGAFVERLSELRTAVTFEQRVLRGLSAELLPDFSLATLTQALAAGGAIPPGKAAAYEEMAEIRDLHERSALLRTQVNARDMVSPRALIVRLERLFADIVAEQYLVRRPEGEHLPELTMLRMVRALELARRIPGESDTYTRAAAAWDLHHRSRILQTQIDDVDLGHPNALVQKLVVLRPLVEEEQRALGLLEASGGKLSLRMLLDALIACGRVRDDIALYERISGAWEVYDRSPTLRAIPREALRDDAEMMRYLLALRDRIAFENFEAEGTMHPADLPAPGLAERYSLAELATALYAAGRITTLEETVRIQSTVAAPLEYVLKRRQAIELELERLMKLGLAEGLWAHADRGRFTRINNPAMTVSTKELRNIIRWGIWFLGDASIVLRSIYGGGDIAYMALTGHPDLIEKAPSAVRDHFENAAWRAPHDTALSRREAVEGLRDLLAHYDALAEGKTPLPPAMAAEVEELRRIYAWNKDALEIPLPAPKPSPAKGGKGGGGTKGGKGGSAPKGHAGRAPRFTGVVEPGGDGPKASAGPGDAGIDATAAAAAEGAEQGARLMSDPGHAAIVPPAVPPTIIP